jgi:hypothetical protein
MTAVRSQTEATISLFLAASRPDGKSTLLPIQRISRGLSCGEKRERSEADHWSSYNAGFKIRDIIQPLAWASYVSTRLKY